MAVTPSYLSFLVDQLEAFGAVTAKRMFGGIGLYTGERIFGLIDDDVVFFKVDDESRPDYEARGMPPFRPVSSKPELVSKNYYQVPGEIVEDAEALTVWAQRAAKAAAAPKPQQKRKKSAKRGPVRAKPAKSRQARRR
jgi:DNA transformation protein